MKHKSHLKEHRQTVACIYTDWADKTTQGAGAEEKVPRAVL